MLELKKVSWKNFMSYGDYMSSVDLDNLGQCLITGEVVESDTRDTLDTEAVEGIKKSNGAGKSTLVNVIQWVIFGRTMHSNNPGDKVVNYFTGKECYGRVDFKNGDYIIRTRKSKNGNELIYCKAGEEFKTVADTVSTTKNQQTILNRVFNLDWELFSGSVFFNQYGKPWMEMGENARKKAFERLLHVDRFAYYTKVAKAKIDHATGSNKSDLMLYENHKKSIEDTKETIKDLEEARTEFETNKRHRIAAKITEIEQIKAKILATELPDIAKLKSKWDLIDKIKDKIAQLEQANDHIRQSLRVKKSELSDLENSRRSLKYDIEERKKKIKSWEEKQGKACLTCSQIIEAEHVKTQVEPYKKEIKQLEKSEQDKKKTIDSIQEEIDALQAELKQKEEKLENSKATLREKKPEMTLIDAKAIYDRVEAWKKDIEDIKVKARSIKDEPNPHDKPLIKAKNDIISREKLMAGYTENVQKNEHLIKHLNYVYKAYNDRNRIKADVFKEYIPFINARLKHYLDVMNLDIRIELNENLSVKSDKWDYEFESGGERKRTDIAFMLATFDFHEYMYGRQCNILVMDEVDGRMDDDGIDSLINIIKNDLASKIESILIISHKKDMSDVFPSQINVIREDRFSRIAGVVR